MNLNGDGPLLLGIDLGSTSTKAVICDVYGATVASATTPTITHYPRPLWAYYEPAELWESVVGAIRGAVSAISQPSRISGIAVASFAEAGVPIDEAGESTCESIAWFDRRTMSQCEWLAEHIGEERLFASTGLALQPIFTLNKLLWIKENEPASWNRTVRWLMAADYIAFRLCGGQATDYSLASRSLAFNLAGLAWDEELIEAAGIAADIFAPVKQAGTPIGTVSASAAKETGLPTSAVVGVGGHDHVCGAFAAGVVEHGHLLDSMGTAEALFLAQNEPITDQALGRLGYTQGAHVAPGKYYTFGGLYTSGASIEWLREALGHTGHSEVVEEAAQVPPGSLGAVFLPHLRLSNAPNLDSKARGALLGLSTDTLKPAIVRAVLEGLAYEGRLTVEPLIDFLGEPTIPEVAVIGGGKRNELLVQIKASVMNTRHRIVDIEEETALGAAMLGGLAAGLYANAREALDSVRLTRHSIEPEPEWAGFYDRFYREVYQKIYPALRPLNHSIYDLVVDLSVPVEA